MEKKDEFFLVCTHPLQGTLRQGRRRGGEEGVVLLLRAAVGGTRLRMRDVLQADRALADLVELAAPAASASRFPASSLRFPLPRQQPPLPASPPAASASPPRATATRELSLQFPKKKKTAKDAPTRARRASRRRRPGAGRRARCGCRCRRRRACGRASGGLSSFFTPFFCFFGFRDSEFSLLPLCPFPSSTFSLSFLPTLALLPSARALELASTCL
jgi:hypothetical protein